MLWVPKPNCSGSSTSESSCSSISPAAPTPRTCEYKVVKSTCKFYNPYFKSGCIHGNNCSFRHLSQPAFSEYCRKLIERKPLSPVETDRFRDAQRHFREQRYQTARKIFGALASKYPFCAALNIWLARTHDQVFMSSDKMQNVGCAGYYYRRAISIEPDNAYYHGRYASSAYWLGQHRECRVHFTRSLSLKDDNSSVHRDYGHYLHHIEHRLDLAEEHYLKCLKLFQGDQDCHYFYANLLVEQKRYQEAEHHFQATFKYKRPRGKGNLRFHLSFARCLKIMGKYEQSKKQFLLCLSLNEMDSTVLFEYGQLLCSQLGMESDHHGRRQLKIGPREDVQRLQDYKKGLKHIRTSLNIEYREDTKRVLDRLEKQYDAILEAERERKIETERRRKQQMLDHDRVRTPQRTREGAGGHTVNERGRGQMQSGSRHKVRASVVVDDDEKCDPKEDALRIARQIRESEFERFMNFQSFLNDKVRAEYVAEFKRKNLNDIILLKIDTDAFMDELGIRNLVHSTLIKKKIERFKREMDAFHDWLIRLRMEETLGIFEKYGVLTFEQFEHHIKSESDLKWLLGDTMEKHAEVIWNAHKLHRAY